MVLWTFPKRYNGLKVKYQKNIKRNEMPTRNKKIHRESSIKWCSLSDFNNAKRFFAFACVDLVIVTDAGVILTKRQSRRIRGLASSWWDCA